MILEKLIAVNYQPLAVFYCYRLISRWVFKIVKYPPYQGGIKGGSKTKYIFNLIETTYLELFNLIILKFSTQSLLSVSFLMPIPGVFNYYLEIGILGMPTENLFSFITTAD